MPELATMSITVEVTPQAAKGLQAIVRERLTSSLPKSPAERGGGVLNQVTGHASGNVVQARDIHGNVNLGR